jgi:chemosensory pili system protein ChpA (sensor histidine kinase/response regulator)
MANVATMSDLATQSLDLVSRELTSTLEAARSQLEDYIDGRAGRETLMRCAELLHLSRGALKIVEVHGAALLAEEMEATSRHLAALSDQDELDRGVETLTRAMVQLPAYLDRLLSGGRDVALVLLPLLNDLRQARGRPLLSEGTLVLLNASPPAEAAATTRPQPDTAALRQFQATALALRPAFQVALLGWIRGENPAGNLRELVRLSRALEQAAATEPVQQLWYVLTGLIEALSEGGLEETVTLKRLFGQADRQLKRLIDEGEAAFATAPPVDLLNNLLYYVARAESTGERLDSIRESYELGEVIPNEGQLVEAREGLAGPSVKLMRTVAEAIKEDLGSVKDVLDIFVRTGMEDVDQLKPQLDMLKKIGDTLGVLGLERLRDEIQQEAKALNVIVANRRVSDIAVLEKMAATLLGVEDTLDRELVRAIVPAEGQEVPTETDSQAQYRQVTQSVMGECIVNLAKVKEAVIQLVDNPGNVRALDQVDPQLRGITAGLLMLSKTQAVRAVERIGKVIATRLAPSHKPMKPELLERLADAIVSVEYYMETVSSGRTDPWYMLENAERCLELLESIPAPTAPPEPPPAAEPPPQPEISEAPRAAEPAVMEVDEERSDPELVELFIEEAKEEIASIKRHLPVWRENPDASDALISVRRSFHTLKGSGRMVGAQLIGEYAWSIEILLNRLINQTLKATPAMIDFIGRATDVLPQLVEQLEIGTRPSADIHVFMKQAEAFAEGHPDAESLSSESLRAPALQQEPAADLPEQEAEAAASQMDPVLSEIFVKEMRGHLAAIREYLDKARSGGEPYPVEEPLYRACHTLLGSANMAAFEPAIRLATPLAQHLGEHHEAGSGLSGAGLRALANAADTIDRMAGVLASNSPFSEDISEVLDQLGSLAPTVAELAEQPGPAEAEPRPEPVEFDPEIAAIFTEEASEILENAELALNDFRQDTTPAKLAELQRLLHTLKGGARMAGITPMGNLSHALETLVAGMANSKVEFGADAIGVVQQSLDQLHHMRDAITAGRSVEDAGTLVGRIAMLSHPSAAAPSAPRSAAPVSTPPAEAAGQAEIPPLSDDDLAALEAIGDVRSSVPPPSATQQDSPPGERTIAIREPEAVEPPRPEAPAAVPTEPSPAAAQKPQVAVSGQELTRVDADLLDELLNGAGEISIFQSRLNQQVHSIDFHLGELTQTVARLREQLRKLEAETEAQILHRHHDDGGLDQDFDPLELDRYSTIQQLSRGLAETANDVASINDLLRGLTNETDTLLTQQARVTAELQDGLMHTRMVPLQRHVSRLTRIVRQASVDTGKSAELLVAGAHGELDRQVLECMLAPFEHLLRNAVVHGIESPESRLAKGKPESGRVSLKLQREGSEVFIEVADDGAGLDLQSVRRKALELGLLDAGEEVSDEDAMELILRPGFSTADELTQAAGRGVGMDVVDTEIKKLGGSLRIESVPDEGTRFLIRLPYTLAITNALIMNVGEETFAVPLHTVEGVTRVPKDQLLELLTQDDPKLDHDGVSYRIQHLGTLVGAAPSALPEDDEWVSLVRVRAGDASTALLTDSLEGSREVVVKTLGPHIGSIPGVSGATILGDGRIIVILDVGALVRAQREEELPRAPAVAPLDQHVTALVVDDSITMRRVTQRLLERRGVRVLTARDGLDAISVLQDHEPDIILLDIEMPRMDGYQFATHVRNDARLKDVPIIMITSRSGEKHRARAIEIGVNDYLSKPYQEGQLVKAMEALLRRNL